MIFARLASINFYLSRRLSAVIASLRSVIYFGLYLVMSLSQKNLTDIGVNVSDFVPELDEGPLSNIRYDSKAFSDGFYGSGGIVAALDAYENVIEVEDPEEDDDGVKREISILQSSGSCEKRTTRSILRHEELQTIPNVFESGSDYAVVFGDMIEAEVCHISAAMKAVDLTDIVMLMVKPHIGRLRINSNKRCRFLRAGQRVLITVRSEENLSGSAIVINYNEDLPELPLSLVNDSDYDVIIRFSMPRESEAKKGKELNVLFYEQRDEFTISNIYQKVDLELEFDETPFRRASQALTKIDFQTSKLGNRVRTFDSRNHIPTNAMDPAAPQLTVDMINFILGNHAMKLRYENFDAANPPYILDGAYLLNRKQKEAVHLAMSNYISLIQGPPGTGKSTTAVAIILSSIANNKRVLVTAPSNGAIDNLLRLVIQRSNQRVKDKIIRLCSIVADHNIGDDLKSYTLESRAKLELDRRVDDDYSFVNCEFIRYRKMLQDSQKLNKSEYGKFTRYKAKMHRNLMREKYSVIFTTTNAAGDFRLRGTFFHFVVIDECGQDIECNTIIPIMRLHCSGQVCLLGDQNQLGPVVLSQEAASHGFDRSLFDRLIRLRLNGYNVPFIMLTEQYRMHLKISNLVSELFYGSCLECKVDTNERTLIMNPKERVRLGFLNQEKPVIFLGSYGPESRNDFGSCFNDVELTIIEFVLRQLIFVGKVVSHSFGIITSYTAQAEKIVDIVRKINDTVISEKFEVKPKIDVATVSGFQGQERDIIIYSLVRSNRRGFIGFLEDYRRLNVAISRARYMLILIGNPSMFCHSKVSESDPYYRLIKLISNDSSVGYLRLNHEPSLANFTMLNINACRNQCPYVQSGDRWSEGIFRNCVVLKIDDFSRQPGGSRFECQSVERIISDQIIAKNVLNLMDGQLIVLKTSKKSMTLLVDENLIRVIIGKGGANINFLTQEYKVDIYVQNLHLRVLPFVEVLVNGISIDHLIKTLLGIAHLINIEKAKKQDLDECFYHRSRRLQQQCTSVHRFQDWDRFEADLDDAFILIQDVGVYIEVHIRHDLRGRLLRNNNEFFEIMWKLCNVLYQVSRDNMQSEFSCVRFEYSKCTNLSSDEIVRAAREFIRQGIITHSFPKRKPEFSSYDRLTEKQRLEFLKFIKSHM